MSDWSEALHDHSVKASNTYNDAGMAYDLSNASKQILYLEQQIERLKAENENLREGVQSARDLIKDLTKNPPNKATRAAILAMMAMETTNE